MRWQTHGLLQISATLRHNFPEFQSGPNTFQCLFLLILEEIVAALTIIQRPKPFTSRPLPASGWSPLWHGGKLPEQQRHDDEQHNSQHQAQLKSIANMILTACSGFTTAVGSTNASQEQHQQQQQKQPQQHCSALHATRRSEGYKGKETRTKNAISKIYTFWQPQYSETEFVCSFARFAYFLELSVGAESRHRFA